MGTNNNGVITTATNQNILLAIRHHGTNKNAVATAAGIPGTTFDRKINGKNDFTLSELGDIADALGLTLGDILPAEIFAKAAA
jgi:hypothetical protein